MKILLVDDDVGVIQALLPALKSVRGYQARAAISGEKAIENAETWEGIDLLVTDVFMEPMNGFTLRNKLRKRYPAMQTLFISGYELESYADFIEDCPTMVKPVNPLELLRVINSLGIRIKTATVIPKIPTSSSSVTVSRTARAVLTGTVEVMAPMPAAIPGTEAKLDANLATGEGMEGRILGAYKIIRKTRDSNWGAVYQALQVAMNRVVALEMLSPELQKDSLVKQQFIANASVKANVQHPFVLSVYEAGDVAGCYFYTYEYVEGQTLMSLVANGKTIDEQTALRIVKGVAEALAYFHQNKIPHGDLDASSIYLSVNKQPRLANLATQDGSFQSPQEEIKTLAEILSTALPGGQAVGKSLKTMLSSMQAEGERAFHSWNAVLQLCQALQSKTIPSDVVQIRAQDEVARQVVEEARKRQKRQVFWSLLSVVSLLTLAGFSVWWTFFRSNEKAFNTMVKIPAGEFLYQNGEKVTLPDFWIDEHEVSIGQYAKFIEYLDTHPDEAGKYDHANQPKGKLHKPANWEIYYGRAKARKPVKFIPINLNCPIFLVDWWDAYAYAKWKGRRLPTEKEWEKAARGTDGRFYPWGNDWDPKKCNSNADYSENPNDKGAVDGYNRWSPVDAIGTDKSPYGVIGMAGNVSEWTDTWDDRGKFPVVRGGNYHSADNKVTHRVAELDPEGTSEYLGFRTAADQPPSAQ